MMSSVLQVAPNTDTPVASVWTLPPVTSVRLSDWFAKKPIDRPSGDQKG